MNSWDHFVSSSLLTNVSLTLLHSVWQAFLVAGCLTGVCRFIPAGKCDLRYAVSLGALAMTLAFGLVTLAWLEQPSAVTTESSSVSLQEPAKSVAQRESKRSVLARTGTTLAAAPGFMQQRRNWQLCVVSVWGAGMCLMFVRIGSGAWRAHRLGTRSRSADQDLRDVADRLCERAGIRRTVRIAVTEHLRTPAVMGFFKHCILVPPGLASGLTAQQLEAVLAHEISHIRRHDALINLGQMCVEAVLFFNPAVWWISRQVRTERESCCDAEAVRLTGSRIGYAEAITCWAEQMQQRLRSDTVEAPALAMALSDARQTTLLERVRRLLLPEERPIPQFSVATLLYALPVTFILIAVLWRGTEAAVTVARAWMDDEARIQNLVQKRNQFLSPAKPISSNVDPWSIRIILTTDHDGPLKDDVHVNYSTASYSRNSTMGALTTFRGASKETAASVSHEKLDVMVTSSAYAPVLIRGITKESSDAELNIHLSDGFAATVAVVSEEGIPIPDAQIEATLQYASGQSTNGNLRTRTNEKGVFDVPHAPDQKVMAFSVTADGYEETDSGVMKLTPDSPPTIVLKKATPVEGIVVDANGEPVPNARFWQVIRSRKRSATNTESVSFGLPARINADTRFAALTDADGRFRLSTLRDGWQYTFVIYGGERGIGIVHDIRSGMSAQHIKLPPPIRIAGTVSGDLEFLSETDNDLELGFTRTIQSALLTTTDSSLRIPLTVSEGKGHFELTNVLPGIYSFHLRSRVGRHARRIELLNDLHVTKTVANLELKFDTDKRVPSAHEQQRKVTLKFLTEPENPIFQGRISIVSKRPGTSEYFHEEHDVDDGTLTLDVVVPGRLSWKPVDVTGYWFEDSFENYIELDASSMKPVIHEIPVSPGGAIYGHVAAADGVELDFSKVSVSCEMKWRVDSGFRSTGRGATLTDDGRFFLSPIRYGTTCTLMVRHGAWSRVLDPITIDAVTPQPQIDLQVESGVPLAGVVLLPDGQPADNIEISARVLYTGHDDFRLGSVITGRDGRFDLGTMNPASGTHQLVLNFQRDYESRYVTIDEGASPLVIQLASGQVLEGQLIDADTDQPIAGAEVYARNPVFDPLQFFGRNAEGPTDSDGRFRFSNLSEGDYILNSRVVHGRVVGPATVSAGQKNVILKVRR